MTVHLIMHKDLRNSFYNPLNKHSATMNWIKWELAIDRLDTRIRKGSTITHIFIRSKG